MALATAAPETFGPLLRAWRQRRRFSQLELGGRADVSARHLSFLETGRARPSREMVLHLAEALDVPLRERNALLVAAGFAPRYGNRPLDDRHMAAVRAGLDRLLAAHEPNPALLVDHHWNIVGANQAVAVFLDLVDPALLAATTNVIRLSVAPNGLAPHIVNFSEYVGHMVHRLRRQLDATGDPAVAELLEELVPHDRHAHESGPVEVVLPLRLRPRAGGELRFFSTIATFGAPMDVTLEELALETFLPADDDTSARLRDMVEAR